MSSGADEDGAGHWHGFLYDGEQWAAFDYPGAYDTHAYGIGAGRVVGVYTDSRGYGYGLLGDN